MRMTDEEVAGMVTTRMTSASACLDQGRRSPAKVARLLEQLKRRSSFDESSRWIRESDTQLHRAVSVVFEHHAGNQAACSRTWRIVLGNLHSFAEQKGEWRLLDSMKSAAYLREVMGSVRAKGKESQCRNKSEVR